jgi:hypothetical protein
MHNAVTLRFGFPDDAASLARLAALDSSRLPAQPVLIAEVGGEPAAALSLSDGSLVADPFQPTAQLVDLLTERARQLVDPAGGTPAERAWTVRLPRVRLRLRPGG